MSESKQRFLVAYDYGMGGLWGIMDARSDAEIKEKYPELTIVHERPKWMSRKRYEELCENENHDIDETASWGILQAVLADRKKQ